MATEYGETLLPEAENVTVLAGRIPVADIIRMLQETRVRSGDRCHPPYAASITESICTGLPGDGDGISAPAAAVL